MPATAPPPIATLDTIATQAQAFTTFLNLPFRDHVWRGQSGDLSGSGAGSSLDFQDHRNYLPGDDPRHINWQAFARSGNYTMKLYREEVRPMVDLVVDVSGSMFCGTEKAERVAELVYFCAASALRTGASLRCFQADGAAHHQLEVAALFAHRWIDPLEASGDSSSSETSLKIAPLPFRGGSMRVLISDLLFPGSPDPTVTALSTRSGRGIILTPFSKAEAEPTWDGNYEFIDAESPIRQQNRIEPAVLRRYRDAYNRHCALWKSAAVKHGVRLGRIPADGDFQKSLQFEAVPARAIAL